MTNDGAMMTGITYREIKPLERIEQGDEFTWIALYDAAVVSDKEPEWYPCETFVGSRVEQLSKRANLKFRRRTWPEPKA